MGKITELTDEQRAQLAPYAQAWIEWVLRTDPTTADERARVEDGMRRCYEAAGIPWHGRVVWVRSPLVACTAEPIAAHILQHVNDAVRDAVDDAVDDAVGGAVDGAVGDAVRDAVRDAWFRYMSPWWSWDALRAACVEIVGVPQAQHLVDALRDANSAGIWWPHTHFVIVSDRPSVINREQIGPSGWGSHRLHSATGPSIAWGDEWALWHWHGTPVPEWVITNPTIEAIQNEPNTEIRRCAIESFGWPRYLDALGLQPVDTAPDPGNPGHRLELYDLPTDTQPFTEPVRLLVMRNASLDRDGTRRTFAETVPASIGDAVSAAAWQFDIDPAIYRQLERAT